MEMTYLYMPEGGDELYELLEECSKYRVRYETMKKLAECYRDSEAELKRDNDLMKMTLENGAHGDHYIIGCKFGDDMKEDEYSVSRGDYCDDCKKKRDDFAVISFRGLNKLITERDALKQKSNNFDSINEKLHKRINKLQNKLDNQTNKHKARIDELTAEIKNQKKKYNSLFDKYSMFKKDFKIRLSTAKNIEREAEKLIETYETYHENIIVLEEYAILEQYINELCFSISNKKRDYNANPTIYNNIYTLMDLMNTGEEKNIMGVDIKTFAGMFLELKNERIRIAHPEISTAEDKVKKIIERRI